jgi:hypothetical protein
MSSDISIENFRGDYENLEKMAISSWRDEYGLASFPNFYRPAFLKFLIERYSDKRHIVAAYRGDEIVAFFANLPRRFHFKGKKYKAVLSCLLVTRKEELRRGVALAVINEALKQNKEYHYDFALYTLEKGHRSTLMIKKLEEAGNPVEWVKKQNVIARVLDLDRVAASEGLKGWERAAIKLWGAHKPPKPSRERRLREYRRENLDQCLDLLNSYHDKVTLALDWDRESLGWELDYPDVSQTLVWEKEGKIEGLINFIYHNHLGKLKERWAWINHVAYPGLTNKERKTFILDFLRYIQEVGCIGAIEWTKKYYPQWPFIRAHFFPYFRSVAMVSWTFNKDITLKNIPDVYEIQI